MALLAVASSPRLAYDYGRYASTAAHHLVGQFGDKFRQTRESKKLSLDDVSNVTKIGTRMLQAIEEEHFDLLPGGVFNKGFIRAYAKHLGLSPEEAVTDYLACLRQAQIEANEVRPNEFRPKDTRPAEIRPSPGKPPGVRSNDVRSNEVRLKGIQPPTEIRPSDSRTNEVRRPEPVVASTVTSAAKSPQAYTKPTLSKQAQVEVEDELPDLQLPRAEHVRKPPREFLRQDQHFSWRIFAAIAVIVIMGLLFWIRHSRSATQSTAKLLPPPVQAAQSSPAQVPQQTSQASHDTTPAKPAVTASSTNTAPPAKVAPSAPATQAPPPQPKPAVTPAPAAPEQKTSSDDADPQPPVKKAPAPVKSATKLVLVIRASETSWISVTADGQLASQETLIAPAATTVHAAREIVVRIGNAAGVNFTWNGKEIAAQGSESEARTIVFDANGMHSSGSAVTPP